MKGKERRGKVPVEEKIRPRDEEVMTRRETYVSNKCTEENVNSEES